MHSCRNYFAVNLSLLLQKPGTPPGEFRCPSPAPCLISQVHTLPHRSISRVKHRKRSMFPDVLTGSRVKRRSMVCIISRQVLIWRQAAHSCPGMHFLHHPALAARSEPNRTRSSQIEPIRAKKVTGLKFLYSGGCGKCASIVQPCAPNVQPCAPMCSHVHQNCG